MGQIVIKINKYSIFVINSIQITIHYIELFSSSIFAWKISDVIWCEQTYQASSRITRIHT